MTMETSNIRFTGTMPALITPFDENGRVRHKAVEGLIEWHLKAGSTGFYVCGSTGEGPALRASTRMEMLETVVDAVRGRGSVICHTGAPNIWDAVELTEHATRAGADAISSLAPTYSFKYTQDELVDYYKTLADHTDKAMLVYATAAIGVSSFAPLMARLLEIGPVIGVKFTIRDYFELRKTKEVNGGNINLINGPDETLICGLVMGADGGIGTTYNLMPDWYAKLYDAFQAGDIAAAQNYQFMANRVTEVLIRFSKFGAIRATKAALELKGFDVGRAVYPAGDLSKDERAALQKELEKLGIDFA